MKISACVILYNPKEEDLKNINTYINKIEKVYVYDNTESKSNESFFNEYKNVDYYWDGENKGLSIRLNQACLKAIEEKFEYLLTMDQDSSFLEKNIDKYFNDIFNHKYKQITANFGLKYDQEFLEFTSEEIEILHKDHIITSGSVMNLSLYSKIGGFDENFFIDLVDFDYCFASVKNGFFNVEFQNNFFKHSLGEVVLRPPALFPFKLLKKEVTIHQSIRIYYMYRNLLFFEKKYKNYFPDLTKQLNKDYKGHIKKCVKYSTQLFKTLKLLLKARRDFKRNKMGKIQLKN
jgi:rhamnosyltransferase